MSDIPPPSHLPLYTTPFSCKIRDMNQFIKKLITSPHAPGNLRWWYAIIGLVVATVGALVPTLLAASMADTTEALKNTTTLLLPLQYLTMFVVGVLAVRLLRGKPYTNADLGLTTLITTRQFVYSGLMGVLFVAIAAAGTTLLPALNEAGDKVANQVGLGENAMRDLAMIFSAAIAAPLGEELVYRGIIFKSLYDTLARMKSKITKGAAFIVPALISSFLFATAHGGEGQSVQVWFLALCGLMMAWLYWKTNSLYAPVFAHSVINMINMFFMSIAAPHGVIPGAYALIAIAPLVSVGTLWLCRKLLGGRHVAA